MEMRFKVNGRTEAEIDKKVRDIIENVTAQDYTFNYVMSPLIETWQQQQTEPYIWTASVTVEVEQRA
jgi:hypothetical protein